MLDTWTLSILKHRKILALIWLLVIAAGAVASTKLDSHLTTSLGVPNSSSAAADKILNRTFHENVEGTFTVIYPFKNASSTEIAGFESAIASAAKLIPTSSIAEEKALGGTLFVNINTNLSLSEASRFTFEFRAALKSKNLSGAMVTGPPAIKSDVSPILNSDLRHGEVIGVLVALLVLLLVLGFSLQILTPLIFAMASISATVGAVFLIAQKFLVVLYIPNIVELIGLGLAIDYSLLMLFRFRRELEKSPQEREAAIGRTMQSAGRTVLLSGVTVAIGLATLTLVPIPFIRSLGITSALVPLISILTAFTLQPILLLWIPQGSRRSIGERFSFSALAKFIIGRPLQVFLTALVIVVALASSVLALHITPSSLTSVPAQLESERAISRITSSVGEGVITPNQLIIDLGKSGLAASPEVVKSRVDLAAAILKNPEVMVVASGSKTPYIDASQRYLRLFIFSRDSFGSSKSQKLVKDLRQISLTKYGFSAQAQMYLGGAAAQGADLLQVLLSTFPWIVLLALLATFLLLARNLRSFVLPFKAILLDLISLSVAYGIVVLSFGNSHLAHLLGIYHLNQIEAWALLFLFVLLFGVSMDYEVFIISRIKEAKERGLTNNEAIAEGVSETGLVVTSAAVIFIGAVSGLALGHFAGLQEIGIGLAFGVLVDATLVRGLLLPSVMVLLGKWNWWMPARFTRK